MQTWTQRVSAARARRAADVTNSFNRLHGAPLAPPLGGLRTPSKRLVNVGLAMEAIHNKVVDLVQKEAGAPLTGAQDEDDWGKA